LSGGVIVGDYAIIGGQVGIGDKAKIESRAIVGSGAGILTSKIVRAGQPVWGTPARPLKDHLEQLAELSRLVKRSKEREEGADPVLHALKGGGALVGSGLLAGRRAFARRLFGGNTPRRAKARRPAGR